MNPKAHIRTFSSNAGAVFLEVIQMSRDPLDARAIVQRVSDLGIPKADVQAKWKSAQPHVANHPHVTRPTTRTYRWSDEPIFASDALSRLSLKIPKSVPEWLVSSLVAVVEAELMNTKLESSLFTDRSHQRRIDDARVFSDIATEFEQLAAEGATTSYLIDWIRTKSVHYQTELIAHYGQVIQFDPRLHTSIAGAPAIAERVTVVRPGYRLTDAAGGDLIRRVNVRPN